MIFSDVNSKRVTTKGIVGFKGYIGKGYLGVDIYKKTGTKGVKGDIGSDGLDGTDGFDGINGIEGDNGDTGIIGTNGTKGVKGDKGDTGETLTSYASVQIIENTTALVGSTLDLSRPMGIVWISPNGTSSGGDRGFVLPLNPPVGYIVFVQNNSGAGWELQTYMSNAVIYGAGNNNIVGFSNGTSRIVRYMGQFTISSVLRNVWVWQG